MPKSRKKRKLDSFSHMANLTGLEGTGGKESLDDCMAEFQIATNSDTRTEHGTNIEKAPTNNHLPSCCKNLDEIESWNRSFLSWAKNIGGNYTPGMLPNIDEELARNFKVKELSTFLLSKGDDLRMPMFERWLLDSKLEERYDPKSRDPVMPIGCSSQSEASQRLIRELRAQKVEEEDARQAVAELCRKCNVACQEHLAQQSRYKKQSPFKKGDRIEKEDHGKSFSILYARKKWKKPFCFRINKEHYEKLRKCFDKIHNSSANTTKLDLENSNVTRGFHIIILALLLRYSALSGGQLLQDLRGGGMQGAIHGQVFEALQSNISGTWFEGFASPFNAYLSNFGSAFPDIDWHFGSVGNFLDFSFPNGGCCEANPPFSPGVMTEMVAHMERQLDLADENKVSLTFIVVVPTAAEGDDVCAAAKQAASESFQKMLASSFCHLHIKLEARKHGFLEGAQHLKPTKYKQSTYDTSIIILQSETALEDCTDLKRLEREVREAFASRHKD